MGSGRARHPDPKGTLPEGPKVSVHETPLVLPGRYLYGPIGPILAFLGVTLHSRPETTALCLSEADNYLFEEGLARFNPLMERGVICWIPSPKQPHVLVDAAPGEPILLAHGVHKLWGGPSPTLVGARGFPGRDEQ